MIHHRFAAAALLMGSLVAAPFARAAEEDLAKGSGFVPPLRPASDEGEKAIAKMRPAKGLKVDLWAAEPMLANPVALNFDERGRCYLVETWRFDHGVIDVRSHGDWLDDDLMSQTVEDRVKLVRRKMGPNVHLFTENSDLIRLLEDTKGTGRADKSTVFAEGFNKIEDGIGAGILARKGNVYFTDIPHLWLLKDTNGDGHADVRRSLGYGYGVHYNFLGHDLHGPRFGPDGKLYFSIGDRAANVTETPDHRHVVNLDSGGVFRCNRDGTGLEIFATGLRNPQSLAFDEYGNLFTGDNNPDYGDPARWVYVVEAGDSGWRVGYQADHNPVGGGPWMWEGLYQTQEKSNAAYLLQPIAHLGAGPSGVAYYPGTGLSEQWNHHFFECDFRGGFTGSGVHSFVMKPKGAGFELADLKDFIWDTLATDIVFGPQGGVYVTDWVQGWAMLGKGRIYHITDPEAMKDPIVEETRKLIAEGMEKRPVDALVKLLSHRDQRVRQEAQFELADRGPATIAALTDVALKGESQLARIHAIWALGQIAEKSPKDGLQSLLPLLQDKDDEIRAQAARALGDHHQQEAYGDFVKLLNDSNPRVRYFVTMGLGKLGKKEAVGPVLQLIRENSDKDMYLRHAGVTALTWINDFSAIEQAAKDSSPSVRMAALLAMRRMEKTEIAQFLNDEDPRLVLEAARAINDLPITAALPQLGAMLAKPGLPDFVAIRVVNANYRLGTPEAASALAHFAADNKAPEKWRVAALQDLADWQEPGHRDRVTNLPRPLPDRDPKVARDAAGPVLAEILNGAPNSVRVAALALIQKLKVNNSAVLSHLISDRKLSPDVRVGALEALAAQNDSSLAEAVKTAMADHDERLRAAAIRATAKLPDAARQIEPLLAKGSTREQQAALASLGDIPGKEADETLASWMDKLLAGQVKPQLQLDLLEAAGKRQDPAVQERIKKYSDSLSKTDALAEFRVAIEGGDAAVGNKIFHERTDASCLRCHTVHGSGGIVGPVLDGIGAKQTREYLLESIILPNAKIAPGFESVILRLKDGKAVTGIVKQETDKEVTIINPDGNKITVNKDDIKSRERGASAMPEGLGKLLPKRDIRDLVEYLASLKR